jgi:nitrite reductase (NO-forming)
MKRLAAMLAGFCCGVAGVVAVACFSERGAGPSGNPLAQCNVPVSVIDSGHYVVAIQNFGFHPDSIAVPVGATVTWVNCETPPQEPHTTTSGTPGNDDGIWNSPDLNPGDRFSHTFPASGVFPYHCTPHPFMLGKVVVQ